MHEIPPEILGKIFQFAALDRGGYTIRDRVLALCLVCKAWHETALLEHHLWGRIDLSKAKRAPGAYEKALAWLERTPANLRALKAGYDRKDQTLAGGHCDCDEALRGTSHTPTACDHGFQVVSQLMKSLPALGHLHLVMRTIMCLHRFRETISAGQRSTAWDTLPSLILTVTDCHSESSPRFLPLRYLPPLRSFDLRLCGKDGKIYNGVDTRPSTMLGLSSLSLTLPLHCASDVLNVLSGCVNLQTLIVDLACLGHLKSTIDTMTFPQLHTLKALRVSGLSASSALQFLRAPNLSNLTVSVSGVGRLRDPTRKTQRDMLEFMQSIGILTCPSGTLRSLRLIGLWAARVDSMDLVNILSALPCVKHLSLACIDFNAKEFLDASRLLSVFVPALETIELQGFSSAFQLHHFLAFVLDLAQRSGRPSGAMPRALKLLDIHFPSSNKGPKGRPRGPYYSSPFVTELRDLGGMSVETYKFGASKYT